MKTFQLTVATSAGKAFEGSVQRVTLRGANGDFAVLYDHAPFMTLVKPCRCVIIDADGGELSGECDGGVFQTAANSATLLTGKIELSSSEK